MGKSCPERGKIATAFSASSDAEWGSFAQTWKEGDGLCSHAGGSRKEGGKKKWFDPRSDPVLKIDSPAGGGEKKGETDRTKKKNHKKNSKSLKNSRES